MRYALLTHATKRTGNLLAMGRSRSQEIDGNWGDQLEKLLVIIMATNPKPSYRITIKNPQRTIISRYSHRPNRFLTINAFEM